MADYIVIFGAAVRADGSASGSLRRRCENAARFGHGAAEARGNLRADEVAGPFFLATGGVGRHGPAEALVMRDMLVDRGIAAQRIVLELQARDTLQSVRLCTRLLLQRPQVDRVWVASSSYHNPRCELLFRLAGFACRAVPTGSDRPFLGWAKWLRYVSKELLATPWDAAWMLVHRIGRTI